MVVVVLSVGLSVIVFMVAPVMERMAISDCLVVCDCVVVICILSVVGFGVILRSSVVAMVISASRAAKAGAAADAGVVCLMSTADVKGARVICLLKILLFTSM